MSLVLTGAEVMQVLDMIREAGVRVIDIRVEEDDLEDVFVKLTQRAD